MSLAVIFICGPTIGSYVNAITHLSWSRGIRQFALVMLSDAHSSAPGASYREDIADCLCSIANGQYRDDVVETDPKQADRYRAAAAILRSELTTVETVVLHELPKFLDRLTRDLRTEQVTIDVTGLTKPLAVQVTIASLVRRLPVYTFELTSPPDPRQPQLALYHKVFPDRFRYPCLTDSTVVMDAMGRFVPKKRLRVAILAVCLISVACFALLLFFEPNSASFSQFTLWFGLVASVVGIGAALVQLTDLERLM